MAATAKITPELEKFILKLSAEGHSTRECAERCLSDHNVQLSPQAVQQMLAKTRTARADVAKAVTREVLRSHIVSDLDRMEEIRVEASLRQPGANDRDFATLAKLELDVLERKLKLSGACEPDRDDRIGVVILPAEDSNDD